VTRVADVHVLLVSLVACPGEYEISSGDGPLPMAIFELLEYIVNEVSDATSNLAVHQVVVVVAQQLFSSRPLTSAIFSHLA